MAPELCDDVQPEEVARPGSVEHPPTSGSASAPGHQSRGERLDGLHGGRTPRGQQLATAAATTSRTATATYVTGSSG